MENNGIQSDSNHYTAELGQENTFYAHRDTSVSHSNDFKNTFLLSEKWSSVVLWWKKNNLVPSKDLVRNKIKGSHGTFFMEDFCWISHQSCCLFRLWHGLFWIKAHHKGTLGCQKLILSFVVELVFLMGKCFSLFSRCIAIYWCDCECTFVFWGCYCAS